MKKSYRGFNVSQDILYLLKIEAGEKDCYKVILDCDKEIQRVYIKSGFEEKGLQMALYL